ncbi:TonB-dependent receptor [Hymenobacter sp. BT18]|uniref:TonB-dependent receptor family protein n=1 Tax=Hymenobacter sp. BT18 TaxID=2835648 RepID=UPI00143E2942|nr:TonB-dependent receptor [Hymenobacter sp. BT18]QIX62838.1 TonB-dependent receptor [Hymenobacter sp. BT18]
MLFRYSLLPPLLWLPVLLCAQTPSPDTTRTVRLPEATVTGYGQQLPLRRTAAAVGVVDAAVFARFSAANLTPAVNTVPGVRLEERATASYRLSVRGSTLRSPFGVRNVKVYYNGLPFTEASGSTPLNLLDAATIGRLEVIKGPAGSVYGAGTGGVALFSTPEPTPGVTRVEGGLTIGSFGLRRATVALETADSLQSLRAQYARQTLDGYRQHSALRRDVLTLDGKWRPNSRQTVSAHLLYSDINYQLPGSLTRAQFAANPRQARPATPTAPGTVEQNAFYASRTALLGGTHEYRFSEQLTLTSTLYGSGSAIRTPFLVDYERNTQVGGGGRTALGYRTRLAGRVLRLAAGAEGQTSFESSRNYRNRGGQPDTLRYDDEIRTSTGFVFAQADWELPAGFLLTAAASYNRLRYRLGRLSGRARAAEEYQLTRRFRPEVSPRLALLKELTPLVSVYASVSSGFSPPTEEEIRPSDGSVNQQLQAERGTSYEVGTRGQLGQNRFSFDVAAYDFQLRQTVVARSNDQGVQLFYNTGRTRQRGVEAALSGWLWRERRVRNQYFRGGSHQQNSYQYGLRAWASYAYNHYRFGQYEAGGNNFSGNRLTGAAPHTLSAGLDFSERLGFYFSPTLSHQARIPLNDTNTTFAAGYWVFGARGGWRHPLPGRLEADLYAGLDNATDRRYSLGNDLNAFGNRFFQPAPGRSYYTGAQLAWRW